VRREDAMPTSARSSAQKTALLIVDVINHFEFPGGDALLANAERTVKPLLALRRAAHARGMPVIYANDNFGDWHSDSGRIMRRCMRRGCPGAGFTKQLAPLARDYFVLKPANSAFYSTTLETLLRALKVQRLIVVGLTADNCVLFTAHDAYLRGFKLHIPSDCVASQRASDAKRALDQLKLTCKADVRPSGAVLARHMHPRSTDPSKGAPHARRSLPSRKKSLV
jgi:nicotinamidase-related amidase